MLLKLDMTKQLTKRILQNILAKTRHTLYIIMYKCMVWIRSVWFKSNPFLSHLYLFINYTALNSRSSKIISFLFDAEEIISLTKLIWLRAVFFIHFTEVYLFILYFISAYNTMPGIQFSLYSPKMWISLCLQNSRTIEKYI